MNQLWTLQCPTSVDHREKFNIEHYFIMTERIIYHTVHIMENKAHYLALILDGFIK